jgi:hypothetical protein
MSRVVPQLSIPVGIVVERLKASTIWADFLWRPIAVLAGVPDTPVWTSLASDGDRATFYAGAADIELHRTEADNYRRNLESGEPAIWVALQPTGGEPPYRLAAVTADPAEGESFTEAGQAIVEAVPMSAPLRAAIAAFVAEHPGQPQFAKRQRDRADPEALARRRRGSPS